VGALEDGSESLSRLIAGELDAVIFQGGETYVQFAMEAGSLRCEAIGDEYLRAPLRYERLQALSRLKFMPPARGGAGNHWQDVPADPGAAAAFAVETLAVVYGAAPENIEVFEV
jgi:hypothetical protein